MVLVGNVITPNDVVADPRYSHLKPEQVTRELLSQYTREEQVRYDFDALKRINSIKEEYGTGVSALVRIYNASGKTLTFETQGPNWHGHMFKYPPDYTILNGQWSVFLHVKTAGAATGSESSVVYTVDDVNQDVFMGWGVPWNQSEWSSKVYTEVNDRNHWPSVTSWDSMYTKINASKKSSVSFFNGTNCSASIGDDTSPVVNYLAAFYTK